MDPRDGEANEDTDDDVQLSALNRALLEATLGNLMFLGPADLLPFEAQVVELIVAILREQKPLWRGPYKDEQIDFSDIKMQVAAGIIARIREHRGPLRVNSAYLCQCARTTIRSQQALDFPDKLSPWPLGYEPIVNDRHVGSPRGDEPARHNDHQTLNLWAQPPELRADVILSVLDEIHRKGDHCISSTADNCLQTKKFVEKTVRTYARRLFHRIKNANVLKDVSENGGKLQGKPISRARRRERERKRLARLKKFMLAYFTTDDHSSGVKGRLAKSLKTSNSCITRLLDQMRHAISETWNVKWNGNATGLGIDAQRKSRSATGDGRKHRPTFAKPSHHFAEQDLLWLATELVTGDSKACRHASETLANQRMLTALSVLTRRCDAASREDNPQWSSSEVSETADSLHQFFHVMDLGAKSFRQFDAHSNEPPPWSRELNVFADVVNQASVHRDSPTLSQLVNKAVITAPQLWRVLNHAAQSFPGPFVENNSTRSCSA